MNKIVSTKTLVFVIIACLISCVGFCSFADFNKQTKVFAETVIDDDQVIEAGTGLYQIDDENLYDALWNEYLKKYPTAQSLKVGSFKSFESLNLSYKNIKSISGLMYFKFDNLTTLNLSHNQITTRFSSFDFMTALRSLDISYNQIAYVDCTFATALTAINANNNNISYANISCLKEGGTANLSFNSLDSFEKLVLPQVSASIYLTHNLLVEDAIQTTCTLNLGLQGVKDSSSLDTNSVIRFYGLENVESVQIFSVKDQAESLVQTMEITGESEYCQLTNMQIGDYILKFVQEGDSFENISFVVRPLKPTVVVESIDGEKFSEPYLIKQKAVVKISANGDVYYSINGGEKKQGNTILIEKNGSYTITCYQHLDDYDSETETILIICKFSSPISIVWLVIGIVLLAILLYVGYAWKNNLSTIKIGDKKVDRNFE